MGQALHLATLRACSCRANEVAVRATVRGVPQPASPSWQPRSRAGCDGIGTSWGFQTAQALIPTARMGIVRSPITPSFCADARIRRGSAAMISTFRTSCGGRVMDARSLAIAFGGEVSGTDRILCPGPGHSPRDRSLSVRLDPHAPDGFLVHSFSSDDFRECRDHVRRYLGLARARGKQGDKLWCFIRSARRRARGGLQEPIVPMLLRS
jgi:hypothetical protein